MLYPGGRIYSPNRAQQMAAPPVMAQSTTNLRRAPYTSHEDKFDGENELLEITLPPPAAYDQGYQSSYQGCQPLEQCYQPQEQVPSRMKPGYPQVFQEYQTVLPAAAYPPGVAVKGVHPNLQYISSVPLSQGYGPAPVPTSQAGPAPSFATLPHSKVTTSSSFSVLPPAKEAGQDGRVEDSKMSTVYNPLTLFPSPTYAQKTVAPNTDRALHTGSLKRGVKPPAQDILRIRDSTRSRSASLSSVTSNKRESSVACSGPARAAAAEEAAGRRRVFLHNVRCFYYVTRKVTPPLLGKQLNAITVTQAGGRTRESRPSHQARYRTFRCVRTGKLEAVKTPIVGELKELLIKETGRGGCHRATPGGLPPHPGPALECPLPSFPIPPHHTTPGSRPERQGVHRCSLHRAAASTRDQLASFEAFRGEAGVVSVSRCREGKRRGVPGLYVHAPFFPR
ncbi:hypothetical protein E2C01_058048 [Portunus trituberculatus]|uniref:Uncharacterized protein n=1 Tax=Portunus trituberculatus TaxID=210409 RepID=A0A5B7H1Z0_PORTR|nr:hypothetical protein [Portunus trituberculatus]